MATQSPLVSIITPVYNAAAFLPATWAGLRSQTVGDWEWLPVDDASSDSSFELLSQYAREDARIKPLRLERNGGPARARNAAIERAQGRYIAFCDSDDVWLSGKLERQIAALQASDAAVCFTSYFKMDEDGTHTDRVVSAKPLVTYGMMLKSNFIGCSTAVYDSARCDKVLMPDILKRQDYGLWLRILQKGHTAIGLAEPLVHYRARANSVSSNKLKAAQYHWKVLREVTRISRPRALLLFCQYAWLGLKKNSI